MQSNNVLISTNLSKDFTGIDLSKHTTPRLNLVFIDSHVPDHAYLAQGVIPDTEVLILKPDQDSIKQITKALKYYSYSYPLSLHIVSHGLPGCLSLGNTQLSLDTLNEYTEDLKTWFSNSPLLIGEGQGERLLLYGCNVAVGDAGAEFITKLHHLTGATIAASTTPTGNAHKGGNWELEITTNPKAETNIAFTETTKQNYSGILMERDTTEDNLFDPLTEEIDADLEATVTTDKSDYPPGSTAEIYGENFEVGETIELQVLHNDGTPNTGGGHEPWQVTDGGEGDLDGKVDGKFQTTWYVNPDDSLDSSFDLTAIGLNSGIFASNTFTDSNPAPVQTFYVPFDEADVLTALGTIGSGAANPIQTYLAIAVGFDGTFIYYDHQENGFEASINNPTQSTTEIWGDGDLNNGVAPGHADDLLSAGDIITLDNAINTNSPSSTDFDGGDKIGASKSVAITRTSWASGTNTLLAGALEMFDTKSWGTSYEIPVGTNTANQGEMFEYTGLVITAQENGTVVDIDTNGDGSNNIQVTLAEGENHLVNNGIQQGATVNSSAPVQVNLITGDIGATYESRWFTLLPTDLWSDSYYTPVGTPTSTAPSYVWLYNPGTSSIDINWETSSGTQTPITLAAGASDFAIIPNSSGGHFFTNDNSPFYALSTTDSDNPGNLTHDWGFTLTPEEALSSQVLVALGLGRDPTSSTNPSENSAPLWVTPVGNTSAVDVYVDFDADGGSLTDPQGNTYDVAYNLNSLQSQIVYDPNDTDQSGTLIYVLDQGVKVAVAWGQDPNTASGGSPAIDVGTGIPPLPEISASKEATLQNDADNDNSISPGDTILYTVNILNTSRSPFPDVTLTDIIPTDTNYVAGTAQVDYNDGSGFQAITDDNTGSTVFPFDEGGLNLHDDITAGTEPAQLAGGEQFSVTYEILIDDFNNLAPGTTQIINQATVSGLDASTEVELKTPLDFAANASVDIQKTVALGHDSGASFATSGELAEGIIGTEVTYYFEVTNTGEAPLTNISITDTNLGISLSDLTLLNGTAGTSLDPGETKVYYYEDIILQDLTNTATVSGNPTYLDGTDLDVNGNLLDDDNVIATDTAEVNENSGTISGNVRDTDNNNLDNVTLQLLDSNGDQVNNSNNNPITVTTDSSGNYSFLNVAPGTYQVAQVQPTGYTSDSEVDGGDDADSGDNGITNNIPVILTDGEDDTGNDFIEAKNGTITGKVSEDDNGSLVGIENVTLQLLDSNGQPVNDSNGADITTITDSNGDYTFNEVEVGSYQVQEVQPTGYGDISEADGLNDGGGDTDNGDNGILNNIPVIIIGGETDSGNNFVESADPGAITGTVTDTNGDGLALVELRLLDSNGTQLDDSNGDPITATTDINGNYNFSNVTKGNYRISQIQPAGYTSFSEVDGGTDQDNTDNGIVNDIPVTLDPAETDTGNDFVEAKNGDITGNVSDTNGNNLVGVELRLLDSASNPVQDTSGAAITTTTDSNGNYIFSNLSPGDYQVAETQPSGYTSVSEVDGSTDGGTDTDNGNNNIPDNIPVTLDPAETDTGNDFVEIKNGNITGNVSDTNGNNLSGVTLRLLDSNSNPVQDTSGAAITTTTDSLGNYTFSDLSPGSYQVAEDQPVDYTSFSEVDGATDGGADTDGGTNNIPDNIPVVLDADETDASNDFVEIKNGNITGNVSDTNGNNLSGVTLRLLDSNSNPVQDTSGAAITTTTDSLGNYTFSDVSPGSYQVAEDQPVDYNDFSEADGGTDGDVSDNGILNNIPVIVSAGETDTGNDFVEDPKPGSITGNVSDDNGNNLVGVTLSLLDSNSQPVNDSNGTPITTTTDSSGNYIFSDIVVGNYQVAETQPIGYNDVSEAEGGDDSDNPDNSILNNISVTISPNETDTGNDFVEDPQPAFITGNVSDTNGTGLVGVEIQLLDSNGTAVTDSNGAAITTITDQDGDYNFSNLDPGEYQIFEVQPTGYTDVSEVDGGTDGDNTDNGIVNNIPVTLNPGETDIGNDFVEEQNGSITGNVSDTNGNNLVGVTLSLLDSTGATVTDSNGADITTTTDSNGDYTFNDVTPGNYQVQEVQPTGYTDVSEVDGATEGGTDTDGGDNSILNNIPVIVAPGEADTGNDFVEEQNGSISGNVSDTNSNNLENVTLRLLDSNGDPVNDSNGAAITTTTDSNGNYTFSDVTPGNYQVAETQPTGYTDVSEVDGTTEGGADSDGGTNNILNNIPVVVTAGEADTGNDFVELLNGSISGKVSDTNGNNLENVELRLLDSNGAAVIDSNGADITTTTDSNGNYIFSDITPGNYQVAETQPTGYTDVSEVDGTTEGGADSDGGTNNILNNIPVVVTAGEADTGNDFVELLNGSISGKVSDTNGNNLENVELRLLDSNGAAVIDSNGADITTTTDSNGNYIFSDITPGNYQVAETQPTGYTDVSEVDGTTEGGADSDGGTNNILNNIPVVVTAGEADTGNDFVELLNGSISGNVSDTNSNNLENVTLRLLDSNGAAVNDSNGAAITTTTDSNGDYTFNDVTPGEYQVAETQPAGYTDVSEVEGGDDSDNGDNNILNNISVTVDAGEADTGNDFVELLNGSISGNVSDTNSNNLENVTLRLLDSNGAAVNDSNGAAITTTTDSNGDYTFNDVTPGEYQVAETQPAGYTDVSEVEGGDDSDNGDNNILNNISVTVDAGEADTGNDFVELLNGSISGNVSDTNSNNLENVTLRLLDSNGAAVNDSNGAAITTTTDSNGDYTFNDVTPGAYQVAETQPTGYTDVSEVEGGDDSDNGDNNILNNISVTVDAGEADTGNDFVEIQNGNITGNVSDNNGNNLEGVEIQLLDSTGAAVTDSNGAAITTTTDSSGNYAFNDLVPGNYQVAEDQPLGYSNSSEVDGATEGGTDTDGGNNNILNNIPVVLDPGETDDGNDFVEIVNPGAIAGRVKDTNDGGLSGVTLRLLDSNGDPVDDINGNPITTVTDQNGNYIFANVTPGNYQVAEDQPLGYSDFSEVDGGTDNDNSDNGIVNNIPVTIDPGEVDIGNDFVEALNGSITGNVSDSNGGLENVEIQLLDSNGDPVDDSNGAAITATTDSLGNYSFSDVTPGAYQVAEVQPNGYSDVSEAEGGNDGDHGYNSILNNISVTVDPGEEDAGNDFVEALNGSITGNVSDNNGSNLPGVEIRLLDSNGDPVNDSNGAAITTTTDSNGNYTFSDVTPGAYQVQEVQPTGYDDVSEVDGGTDGGTDSDGGNNGILNNIPVIVAPGETDDGNNFVEDPQPGNITGNVSDTSGNNLVGVELRLLDSNGIPVTDSNGAAITTTTDSLGNYSFSDVEPGAYQVAETQPFGYHNVSEVDGGTEGGTDTDGGDNGILNNIPVIVAPGETDDGNDFVESPQPGAIVGTVKDTNDSGLVGAELHLLDSNGDPVNDSIGNPITTITDQNGNYSFNNVIPGDYQVREIQPASYSNISEVDGGTDGDNPDNNIVNNIPVTVDPGEVDTGNDFVEALNGSITGNVSDSNGGLENVEIQLLDSNGDPVDDSNGAAITTTTDSLGNYSFSDVTPGEYQIQEIQPVSYSNVSEAEGGNDGDHGDNNLLNNISVTVDPGEEDAGNDFVEVLNGSITGNVSAGNGGLENVELRLLDSNGDPVNDSNGAAITATTDSLGNYSFSDVTPGEYQVQEIQPANYSDVSEAEGGNDGDHGNNNLLNNISVTVDPGEEDAGNDFVEALNGSITGNVSDNSGNNLVGVEIQLLDSNGDPINDSNGSAITATTDSNGNYSFNDVSPGAYQVQEIQPTGYDNVSEVDGTNEGGTDTDGGDNNILNNIPVVVTEGETDNGNNFVESPQPGAITGNVSDTNGDAITGVTLRLLDSSGSSVNDSNGTAITATTDSNGDYTFSNVSPGAYQVQEVQPTGYDDVSEVDGGTDGGTDSDGGTNNILNNIPVIVAPGETDDGNNFVESPQPGAITGNVSDTNGDAVTGVEIQLLDSAGNPVSDSNGASITATTDSNGDYTFSNVSPGAYQVQEVQPTGYDDVSEVDGGTDGGTDSDGGTNNILNNIPVIVAPGETDDGNNFVESPQPGAITGNVSDTNGDAITGVTLRLLDSSGSSVNDSNGTAITATTDSNGDYTFNNVTPGAYQVQEVQPTGYDDVSEVDGGTDGGTDSDGGTNNILNNIPVIVAPGETDDGNNFVESPQPGAITGNVSDTNGDAITGVEIQLLDSTGNPVTDSNGASITATTDSNGDYTFSNVSPGAYQVQEVQPDNYTDVSEVDGLTEGGTDTDGGNNNILNNIPVIVAPGETDDGNNFVESPQPGAITGNVSDTNGDAVTGVEIQLLDSNGAAVTDSNGASITATTDSNGDYTFNNVTPGAYQVQEVQPTGYDDVSEVDGLTEGGTDTDGGNNNILNNIPVIVAPGETDDGNNFVESPQPGAITGNVSDTNGDAVTGVEIQLLDSTGNPVTDSNGASITATTDSNGDYTFNDVIPGAYQVQEVQPSNYTDVSEVDGGTDGGTDTDGGNNNILNNIPVIVSPGEIDDGNNFIEGPQSGFIIGKVKDSNETGLVGVELRLLDSNGDPVTDSNGTPITATTDNDGDYIFSNVTPGDYQVEEVQPAGYSSVSEVDGGIDNDNTDNGIVNNIPVTVDSGETDTGNDFVETLNGNITGNVSDNNGTGLIGVTLNLLNSNGAAVTDSNGAAIITTTDSNGDYTFSNITPGNYQVAETQPSGYSSVSEVDGSTDGGADTDGGNNNIADNIPVTLDPGETDNGNDFVETLNGSITGNVSDNNGNNLPGIEIQLLDSAGNPINDSNGNAITATTDSNGDYTFNDVIPGAYQVQEVQPDNYDDVSEVDGLTEGGTDTDGGNNNILNNIPVIVAPGETDDGNNFVESPQPGAITGNVSDTNGDAVTGVEIQLLDSTGNPVTDSNGASITATTDSNGDYTFNNVTPGAYQVQEVQPTGYDDVSEVDGLTEGGTDSDGGNNNLLNNIPVIVAPGETDDGNDFVESPQPGAITGNVSDTNGEAITGVEIQLLDSSGNPVNDSNGTPITATTDSNGDYTFNNVTPGAYQVQEVQPTGYNNVSEVDGGTDGGTDTDGGNNNLLNNIPVIVAPGETDDGNDFVESPQPGAITGNVSDTNGEAITGVEIQLLDSSGNPVNDSNGTPITATTDSNGDYTFNNVTPGAYQVQEVQPTGYDDVSEVDGGTDGGTDTDGGTNNILNNIPVIVAPGETDDGNNFVESPQSGFIIGTVSDNDGDGIAGVALKLLDSNGDPVNDSNGTAITRITDQNGNYTFSNVTPGDYQVAQTQPIGYSNVSEADGGDDNDNLDNGIVNNIPVTVEPGEIDTGNDFVEIKNGSITGNVSDNNGGLVGVELHLLDSSGDPVNDSNGDPITTITDNDGDYTFSDLVPGDYQVEEVQPAGYSSVSEVDGGIDNDNTDNGIVNNIPVTLDPGEVDNGNDFVETLNGNITGNVSDNNGTGLIGVTLNLLNSNGAAVTDSNGATITTTTDSNGDYTFSNLVPGNYQVAETQPSGYSSVSEVDGSTDGGADTDGGNNNIADNIPVTLDPGETDNGNDFVETLNGSITGNVSDNNGNNLPGIEIQLLDSAGNPINDSNGNAITATTDSNGDYTFSDVTPGAYQVQEVQPDNYTDVSEVDGLTEGGTDTDGGNNNILNNIPVIVAPGETDDGNNFVESPQPGAITGNVSDTNGDAVTGVEIQLLDSAGNPVTDSNGASITTATDSNGDYAFNDGTPGAYQVQEIQPIGYDDVSEVDGATDGGTDSDGGDNGILNNIPVIVDPGETDDGNNFVESPQPGAITGNVSDTNGDAITGVTLNLLDSSGAAVTDSNGASITTTTDSNGDYTFSDVTPGAYQVAETQPSGYSNFSEVDGLAEGGTDTDGGNNNILNNIPVIVAPGETDDGNNFVETAQAGFIVGNVRDTEGDGIGGVELKLLDSNGDPVNDSNGTPLTAITDNNGNYTFSNLVPGDYQVSQTQPSGYTSFSEVDGGSDNDNTDNGIVNNIPVTLDPGESDFGNDFVEAQNGSITGNVSDTNGGLAGVELNLLDSSSNPVNDSNGDAITTTTDSNGDYTFSDVAPGDYQVAETQPSGYVDVSEVDGGSDNDNVDNGIVNNIPVTVDANENDAGNDFVEAIPGTITGTVNDTNGTGLIGVEIQLLDSSGNPVNDSNGTPITATTDSSGDYTFSNLVPGNYQVAETQPSGYDNFSEADGGTDGGADTDGGDNGIVNNIPVTLDPGETDSGNNFVEDPQPGAITGSVSDNNGNGIDGVTLRLLDSNGTTVNDSNGTAITTTTDSNGDYSFNNVEPGNYQVAENQPSGYFNVSEVDGGSDNDNVDNNIVNNIPVTVDPGETDTGNDFVEGPQPGFIVGNVSDIDGNGLGGVELRLLDSNGDPVNDSNGTPITSTTDNNGNYTFSNVTPGDYQVAETQPNGYADSSEVDGGSDGDNADNGIVNNIPVTVEAGETDTGNDFVELANIDYGDAPDGGNGTGTGNYQTTEADGGAAHGIVDGLSIGNNVDADNGELQNATATADDINGTPNDRDGINFTSVLDTNADTYSVTVDVTNSTADAATLIGWIDFNQNGQFEIGEAATTITPIAAGSGQTTQTLTWNGLAGTLPGGNTYARFRLSTDTDLTTSLSTGFVDDGEVEDHQICIADEIGSDASDNLTGDSSNNVFAGYKGQDTLSGGAGDDKFLFNETSDGLDIITDFNQSGNDKIVLTQIFANELSSYTGTDPIADGHLVLTEINHPTLGASTFVQIDFDAGDESSPTDLLHKDIAFLSGVSASSLNLTDDFVI